VLIGQEYAMDTYIMDHYKFPKMNWWFAALDDMDTPTTDRAKLMTYGKWFSSSEASNVEALTIFTNSHANSSNAEVFQCLKDMHSFSNLKFLSIPIDAIDYIDMTRIAPQMEYLRICQPRSIGEHEQGIKKNLRFLECVFPKLWSLQLAFPPVCYRNFDVARFPNLQWLEVNLDEMDKSARSLKRFRDMPTMKGFGLNGVYKKDILNDLNPSIEALEFWNVRTKALDLSLLARFADLQYLTINARAELDARVLATLPRLTELQLWNFQRIDHIEALLDSPSLKRVSLQSIRQGEVSEALRGELKDRFEYAEF
jgi:hypothetical protein